MIKNKVLIVICGILLAICISGCTYSNKIEHISKNMEINLENCKIEEDKDTHGGFLGDGEYFAKIICTENEDREIKANWKKLPLSTELQEVMELIQYDNDGGKTAYERYNIPNLEDGYYNFYDRHSESADNKNEEELNSRSSYNFSLGIYDSENMILYYYELDT